jgi:ammonium transporter Rh
MADVVPENEDYVDAEEMQHDAKNAFAFTLGAFQVIMIILFFTTTDYISSTDEVAKANSGLATDVSQYYVHYSHVAFMIWVGFGFLMTFLRRYSFSAVGLNMLISSFAFEWGILCMAFFHNSSHPGVQALNISWLIEGCFAAGAVMITFGALLGKVSPLQLLWVAALEVPFYALNFHIGYTTLGAVDVGGSMFVHMFGAYFGLGCSMVMAPGRPKDAAGNVVDHNLNSSRTTSDVTAMIGTLFLWLLWPSFNSALAPASTQFRVIINTVLALNGSCISTFLFSRLLSKEGKFDMVHIQNATLAGGVAIGSSADMVVGPGGAITVGVLAGLVSTVGYVRLTPYLSKKLGLDDTCGVNNLHGMPGILGALTGAVAINSATASVYGVSFSSIFKAGRTPDNQPNYQIAAMVITFALALVSGAFSGAVVNSLTDALPGVQKHGEFEGEYPEGHFEDSPYWEVPSDFQKC